jgi:folate-dependent phosphoribosylglycinamide formyltransferase PurN
MKYKFGIFSTGRDIEAIRLFREIYDSVEMGVINGKIAYLFCNREQGEEKITDSLIKLVRDYGIELTTFSSKRFKNVMRKKAIEESKRMRRDSPLLIQWRNEYDREVMERIPASFDIYLIGYMLIIGPEMCKSYNILNLHPAPPGGPQGSWQEVMEKLIQSNAKEAGCMMHLVTPELDKGPPISYCTFPIVGDDYESLWQEYYSTGNYDKLFSKIREEEFKRESPLVIHTIKAFADGKIWIDRKKVMTREGEATKGYCLNGVIEDAIHY